MGKIAVITGGRTHLPTIRELSTLGQLLVKNNISIFRNGCAKGVDTCTTNYVRSNHPNILIEDFPVSPEEWALYKGWAGHRRNKKMLTKSPGADLLIAFPGNEGTKNCIETAQALLIPVLYVNLPPLYL